MKGDYYYGGQEGTMDGVHVENGKVAGLPEHLDQTKKERIQTMLFLPPVPKNFDHSNYLGFWLERIVSRYEGKSTKIVFVHLPNEPLPSQTERPCIDRTIKKLAGYPNVVVADSDEFAELNNPKFFADDIHLNVRGRALFSHLLSAKVLEIAQGGAKTAASFARKDF
jgi:hypothetical protein